jgi:hypothetical protein
MNAGYVEEAHMSDFTFENQRKTFTSYGKKDNNRPFHGSLYIPS